MTKENKKTRKYSRISYDTKLIIYAIYSEKHYTDMTCQDIADYFNISISSLYRIKKEFEQQQ